MFKIPGSGIVTCCMSCVCVVCSFTTLQGGRQHASLGSARCNQPIDLSGYQAALHDVCWVLA
jgi:hypothetical protein